jgi:hypothetical protein
MGTYRQPAIIRNKAGLDAANQAVSDFNDGLADFASKASTARQEKWCQQNPDDCAKINNSKKDKDDNSSSSSQPARVLTPKDDNKTATGSGPTPKMKPPTPKIIKKGGAQTGGSVQYFSSDMEDDMYDNYKKSTFGTPAESNKKNNYKSFYNGED